MFTECVNNAKVTADIIAATQDLKRERKQMELLSNDLALLDSVKASPIKAAQVMSQILVHQMDQNKRTQKLIAEKMRNEMIVFSVIIYCNLLILYGKA